MQRPIKRISDVWKPTTGERYKVAPFVAWDGEGFDVGNETPRQHIYALMAYSDGSIRDSRLGNIDGGNGLSTFDCLAFLCEGYERFPRAIHTIFSGNYDINMLLGDLPREDLETLWRGDRIRVNLNNNIAYRMEWRPRKFFTLERIQRDPFERQIRMTLWDVWGFFQGTFVGAIEKYLGANHPALALIREEKDRRHAFSRKRIEEITRYCLLECDTLVEIMDKLRESFVTTRLPVSRWDGAGAVASALMRREGIQKYMNKEYESRDRQAAVYHAYFGGRIEQLQYGYHRGIVHCYDINSAYPAATRQLPTLSESRWCKGNGRFGKEFGLYRVKWEFKQGKGIAFPFPYRCRNGTILFPPSGEGWYWYPEISAGLDGLSRGYLTGTIEIVDSYILEPRWQYKPFAFIEELYLERKRLKDSKGGAEFALKLGMNSLYGKLAQQVGWRDGKPPRSQQMEWAGWITSQTRATLYRALLTNPDACIQLATDGIYSTEPLEVLLGDNLGEWTHKEAHAIISIQSGVYCLNLNKPEQEEWYRGFGKGAIDFADVIDRWTHVHSDFNGGFSVPVPVTRFVTLGSALMSSELMRCWRRWRTASRNLELVPTEKRVPADKEWGVLLHPARRLLQTIAREADEYELLGEISHSYTYQYEETWDDVNVKEIDAEVEESYV